MSDFGVIYAKRVNNLLVTALRFYKHEILIDKIEVCMKLCLLFHEIQSSPPLLCLKGFYGSVFD